MAKDAATLVKSVSNEELAELLTVAMDRLENMQEGQTSLFNKLGILDERLSSVELNATTQETSGSPLPLEAYKGLTTANLFQGILHAMVAAQAGMNGQRFFTEGPKIRERVLANILTLSLELTAMTVAKMPGLVVSK